MTEEWRPVPGYEGLYSVSDQGRVRSEARRGRRERMLSLIPGHRGHLSVAIYDKDVVRRGFLVHRLVLTAFVRPPEPGEEGCHYPDPDPSNNRLENLMWGTRSVNQQQAVETRNHGSSKKTECKRGHAFDEENTFIDCHGARQCRECMRIRLRNQRARKKAKQ